MPKMGANNNNNNGRKIQLLNRSSVMKQQLL